MINTERNKSDFQIGDFVFYQFMADDMIKGRILELNENSAKIEIGFCAKKSEDIKKEEMDVPYSYLIPVESYLKEQEI